MVGLSMSAKQEISAKLDPALVLALDGLAAQQGTSRGAALEQLLGLAISEREKLKAAERKVNLTVRVSPTVAERVRSVAKVQGCSANQAAADLLEAGIRATLDEQQRGAVEQLAEELREATATAHKVAEGQTHRLAHLLARAVLENLHNRNLMSALLTTQGMLPEQVRSLSDTAFTRAVETLRNPPPTVKAALADLLGGSDG